MQGELVERDFFFCIPMFRTLTGTTNVTFKNSIAPNLTLPVKCQLNQAACANRCLLIGESLRSMEQLRSLAAHETMQRTCSGPGLLAQVCGGLGNDVPPVLDRRVRHILPDRPRPDANGGSSRRSAATVPPKPSARQVVVPVPCLRLL